MKKYKLSVKKHINDKIDTDVWDSADENVDRNVHLSINKNVSRGFYENAFNNVNLSIGDEVWRILRELSKE